MTTIDYVIAKRSSIENRIDSIISEIQTRVNSTDIKNDIKFEHEMMTLIHMLSDAKSELMVYDELMEKHVFKV